MKGEFEMKKFLIACGVIFLCGVVLGAVKEIHTEKSGAEKGSAPEEA